MTTILAWLGVAAGAAAGALAAMAAIGCFIPRYHVAARSVMLPVGAAEAWRVAADFPGQLAWRRGLAAVDRLPDRDGFETWRERSGRHPLVLRTEESEAPGRLVRLIDDEHGPFRGRWDIRIGEVINPSTCRVSIIEEGEIRNPLVRFLHHHVIGEATELERYLTDLAARFGAEPRFILPASPEMDLPPPRRGVFR